MKNEDLWGTGMAKLPGQRPLDGVVSSILHFGMEMHGNLLLERQVYGRGWVFLRCTTHESA